MFIGRTTLLFMDGKSIVSSAPKMKNGCVSAMIRAATSKYLLMFSGVAQIILKISISLVVLIAACSSAKTPLIQDLAGGVSLSSFSCILLSKAVDC